MGSSDQGSLRTMSKESLHQSESLSPSQRGNQRASQSRYTSHLCCSKSSPHRKATSVDWRSSLLSIFVGNLSNRVSKSALWEAFLEYGRVVDVYIPRFSKSSPKGYTFAFVRYKSESDMRKAIVFGNNRRIDGRTIRVNKATHEWKEKKKYEWQEKSQKLPLTGRGSAAFRDNRTYKEVLLVPSTNINENLIEKGFLGDKVNNVEVSAPSNKPEKVEYDLDIPKSEMEWLDRSAIGRIRDGFSLSEIANYLEVEGLCCQVSPMDCISVLLVFCSKMEMVDSIKDERIKSRFVDVIPWGESVMKRETFVWVLLEEVPLQVWHNKFFESLGNRWGSFVCLDDCTINRSRLDVARMLIRVESSLRIPSTVSVNVRGSQSKILVAVEDTEFAGKTQLLVEGKCNSEEKERTGNFSQEAFNGRATPNSPEEMGASQEMVFGSRFSIEYDYTDMGYCSSLSEVELAGGSLSMMQEWAIFPVESSCSRRLEDVGQADKEFTFANVGEDHGLDPCKLLLDNGPFEAVSARVGNDACGPDDFGVNGVNKYLEASLLDPYGDKEIDSRPKIYMPSMRRKKINKRSMAKLVYGREELEMGCSDSSLSDGDIEHRNSVILKKAIATWEVSQALGISFHGDKNQLIDMFKKLEADESLGEMNRS